MTRPGPCPSEKQIAAFADGSLPPAEREAIGGHVDQCEACFELLAAVGGQATVPLPPVDDGLRAARDQGRDSTNETCRVFCLYVCSRGDPRRRRLVVNTGAGRPGARTGRGSAGSRDGAI